MKLMRKGIYRGWRIKEEREVTNRMRLVTGLGRVESSESSHITYLSMVLNIGPDWLHQLIKELEL